MSRRGFTLLEIAIGMAILGLGVVSALQVFGGSVQLARSAGRRTEAVMHAKALMDSALWAPELLHNISHGEIGDGYRWERSIRVAGPEDGILPIDEDNPTNIDVTLSVVSVVVEWDEPTGTKTYQIGTMRVAPNVEE